MLVADNRENSFRRVLRNRRRRTSDIALCAILGTSLAALFGLLTGIPQPRAPDEFSYLLAADTFAHGRLTNPTPPLPEFFESLNVLTIPSYSSKYPPAQGLALAVGKLLFGHPIWGVWLSCGLFAGSLCWMLQAWASRPWAFVTTIFAIVTMGVSTYWAQSYWGGMLAASGGALVFGGLRRTIRSPRVTASLLMALGVLLLANSRPFEGVLTCAPSAIVMAVWFWGRNRLSLSVKASQWLLPFAALLLVGGSVMAVHNHAVTGRWLQMPYALHQRQYWSRDVFLFSPAREPERQAVPRIARFYAGELEKPTHGIGLLLRSGRNFLFRLPVVLQGALGDLELPTTKVPTHFGALLWLGALAAASFCRPWVWFCTLTVVFVVLGESLVQWWYPHYSAPVISLVLAVVADALRRHSLRRVQNRRLATATPKALLIAAAIFGVYFNGIALWRCYAARPANALIGSAAPSEGNSVTSRIELERHLKGQAGTHLVFVHYDESKPRGEDEWVCNGAIPEESRVIFVHDLGRDRNRGLLARFADRSAWLLTMTLAGKELRPYPGEETRADKPH
ncbi:MAG: hypothetical protein ACT4QC_07150 [Planctomycetaceae bacterium]